MFLLLVGMIGEFRPIVTGKFGKSTQRVATRIAKLKNGDVLVGSRLVRRCGVPHVAARRSATYLLVPSPSGGGLGWGLYE